MKNTERGITLIAVIVTIVVFIIITGIALGTMNSRKDTIKEVKKSANAAQRESIIEKIESDLYTEKIKTGKIPSKEKLKEIISNNYGTINKDGENEIDSFTTRIGGYKIDFYEIQGWKQ